MYIVLFLHQTTTLCLILKIIIRCISYYSYIKPQPTCREVCFFVVVYRTIPTSNHNDTTIIKHSGVLYIVLFLHQTTTSSLCNQVQGGCISYYSYIKPQLFPRWFRILKVVYRTIPTSNHNCSTSLSLFIRLYIVLFLHQTTTS